MKPHPLAAVLALASAATGAVDGESPVGGEGAADLAAATRRRRPQRERGDASPADGEGAGPRAARRRRRTAVAENDLPAPGCGPTPGTRHSPYLGCFLDRRNDRAFPYALHADRPRILRLGHGALDCERECSERGYRYFGREFRGQCFCGNVAEGIVRHGRWSGEGGCDCCGANVGKGRVCVWENANHKDSQARPPSIPPALPHQTQTASATTEQVHVGSSSFTSSSNSNSNNQHSSNNSNQMTAPSTPKPTGAFRLRLHWQPGYNWQDDPREQYYCMECRGACRSEASVQVDECSNSVRQKFLAVARTVRPASNPSLCLTVTGYAGRGAPVRLRRCRRGAADQDLREVRSDGKFELRPASNSGRCLSQHHHPKPHEAVFPEECKKTRGSDTSYWRTY